MLSPGITSVRLFDKDEQAWRVRTPKTSSASGFQQVLADISGRTGSADTWVEGRGREPRAERVCGPAAAAEAGQEELSPELRRAARQIEALLAEQLLRGLQATLPGGRLLSGGFGSEVYESMITEGLARVLAEQETLGLAELLVRQMQGPDVKEAPSAAPQVGISARRNRP